MLVPHCSYPKGNLLTSDGWTNWWMKVLCLTKDFIEPIYLNKEGTTGILGESCIYRAHCFLYLHVLSFSAIVLQIFSKSTFWLLGFLNLYILGIATHGKYLWYHYFCETLTKAKDTSKFMVTYKAKRAVVFILWTT